MLNELNKEKDDLRNKISEVSQKIKRIREEKTKAREKEVLERIKKRAEEKLNKGEKLSYEELIALYGEDVSREDVSDNNRL
jgi:uncharacterized coiled-coil DUF342 family protein